MTRPRRCILVILLTLAFAPAAAAEPLLRLGSPRGDTIAVTVPGGTVIEHTQQVFDADPARVLANLNLPRETTVKVNVVAATPALAERSRAAIREHFSRTHRPAVSVVIGAPPPDRADVGIDAVVARAGGPDTPRSRPRIYISGQAEKAVSPAEAAAKTIHNLKGTLWFAGSQPADVVQAKCFLTPMSAAPRVTAEFEKAFPGRTFPLIFVEWKSELPVEIEMVAESSKPAPGDAPAIEYLTPPAMKPSPLFARVVRVNRGPTIYVADTAAARPASGAEQVTSIFEQLQAILKQHNSDLRHLVKATYYVSDDDASKQLNVIRPKFYDPQRPPAASKAIVPAVGVAERSITIDMIAIPTTQPAAKP